MTFSEFWDLPAAGNGYNYFFELCSLLFLIGVTFRHILKKKFNSPLNKLYSLALICAICDLTLDIISCLTIQHADQVPVLLNEWINGSFYLFQIILPVFITTYVIYTAKFSFKNKWTWPFFIPAGLFFLTLASNHWTHWLFYFENNLFKHGTLFLLFYCSAAFYIISTFVLTIVFRKRLSHRNFVVLVSIPILITTALLLQSFFPSVILTGTGITMALLISSITVVNPDEMIDTSTGVFNFNAMMDYLNTQPFNRQRKFYVMVRINNLAEVNDTFGITIYNEVTRKIGYFFNKELDRSIYMFKSRTNKFIAIVKDAETQEKIIKDIRERFAKPFIVNGRQFIFNISMFYFENKGVIKNGDSYVEFINEIGEPCDKEDKDLVMLDDSYMEIVYRTRKIRDILKVCLEKQEGLKMVYQPIYDLKKKVFNHFEALIRMEDDPELGYVGPGDFIPVAEKSGFASAIDFWVLKETCQILKRNPEIEVLEINVSCAEFFDNPSQKYIEIIKEVGVEPSRICIELTETVAAKFPEKTIQFMEDLSEIGIKFAIDDFGTGYSNIARIVQMPFSLIKLDKSLLEEETRVDKFLKSAVSLFKSLEMPIVIEGVDNEEQLEKAEKYGINFIQGYYFSRPLPEDKLIELLHAQK